MTRHPGEEIIGDPGRQWERTALAWTRTWVCYAAALLGLVKYLFGTHATLAAGGVLCLGFLLAKAAGAPRPAPGTVIGLTAVSASLCAAFFLFGFVLR